MVINFLFPETAATNYLGVTVITDISAGIHFWSFFFYCLNLFVLFFVFRFSFIFKIL